MELRAHHLLCIQKFTGHGYDEAFTAQMKAVCAHLLEKPEITVRLRSGCDDLCGACPHRLNGQCRSTDKVAAFDAAVMAVCGLREEDTYSWQYLRRLTFARILQTEQFDAICADCQWYALCRQTEVSDFDEKHEDS